MKTAFLIALAGGALLYAALAFGIYNGLTRQQQGANDFYSRWVGARELILRGENPYAAQTTRAIQMGMYGRLAQPDEDQVAFAYPLYAALIAAPLVFLPYSLAQALWMALLIFCVVGGALALAAVNRIPLTPFAVAGLGLGALFFYPSVRGIFLGQYALFSFACVALAALALTTKHDATAGIFLSIATVKPQPMIFVCPVILFWAWRKQRRRAVWSALLTLALLFGVSFVLTPTWLFDFLNALRAYSEYARVGPPLQTFFQLTLPEPLATILFVAASIVLVAGMVVAVWRNRAREWQEFQPALGLVALVTTLMAGRIGTPDQIFLLILWMAWFAAWGAQKKYGGVALGVCFLLVAPWWLFLQTLDGNREAIVVTTILPLGSLFVYFGSAAQKKFWRRAAT
ncbi:DUF2029 domain-containing protein [Anaerolineae bacterium CFX7]|nr:DUF2029 domain-containing protein [Anaerolineae bacterium CFX7]